MTTPPPLVPAYRDRSTGLKAFGIFTAIFGVLAALLAVFLLGMGVLFQWVKMPEEAARQIDPGMMTYSSGFYLLLAVALFWLGIGSFLCRRWARTLLAIGGWTVLVCGVMGTAMMVVMMPQLLGNMEAEMAKSGVKMSSASLTVMLITQGVMMGFLYIVLPLVWALFYSSRHTRLTCEARDPVARWTDRCPAPVLALALLLSLGVLCAPMAFCFNGVMAFFGTFLSGAPGIVAWCVAGAACVFLAWSAYTLKPYTWWATAGYFLLLGVSNTLTFQRHDLREMFRLMNYPPELLAQMDMSAQVMNPMMVWMSVLWLVPVVGYTIWLRRYFVGGAKVA